MQHYIDTVTSFNGDRIANATITVTDLFGNAVTIYTDVNGTLPVSFVTTNANGEFDFYVPVGRYNITVSGTNIATYTLADVFIYYSNNDPTSVSNLTATGAVTLNTTTNNQSYTTTGAGAINISSGTTGNINNMDIGATTAGTGTFTNLTYTGTLTGSTGIMNIGSGQLYKDASGNVLIGTTSASVPSTTGYISTANTFGFKNRIINGAMQIDQRNAGASVAWGSGVTVGNYNGYSVDRFWVQNFSNTTGYAFTTQQVADAPAGFINSLKITVTTNKASLAAGDVARISQMIEGYNCFDLGFGTASSAPIALSFWVKSSLTGSFGGSLVNSGGTRNYLFSYTIASANTWERKTVIIAGDTTGAWNTDNTIGIQVNFSLGCGSTFSGTAGVWGAGNVLQPTGSVSVVGTNAATFNVTGVQFEKGSAATAFDVRPYGTELELCKWYYRSGVAFGTQRTAGFADCYCSVSMRATPTITPGILNIEGIGAPASQSYVSTGSTASFVRIETSFAAAGALGTPCTHPFTASAEL